MEFRLKQIGLALCLAVSLLVGTGSVGACPPNPAFESTHDEYSDDHHDSHEADTGHSVLPGESFSGNHDCICVADVTYRSLAAKRNVTDLKNGESISGSEQVIPNLAFSAMTTIQEPKPEYAENFSYSFDFEGFRPARAPPRL